MVENKWKKIFLWVYFCMFTFICAALRFEGSVEKDDGNFWRHEEEGCESGWCVNQWISVHPLMSASVNKALISCRHIRWLSSPLGPSWLAEAAHRSLETHLRVYRHLWLVIGSPCEINGTMGAASQPGSSPVPRHTHTRSSHAHTNHQNVCLDAEAYTPICACTHTHTGRSTVAHTWCSGFYACWVN